MNAATTDADPMPSTAWEWARWTTRRWSDATDGQRAAAVEVLGGHKAHWGRFPAPADAELVASPLAPRRPAIDDAAAGGRTASCPDDTPEAAPCGAYAGHPSAIAPPPGGGVVEAPDAPDLDDDLADAVFRPDADGPDDAAQTIPAGPAGALPLVPAIRARADAFRARGTPLGDLFAAALGRLADGAAAVNATRAGDVLDRMDALDAMNLKDALDRAYERGRAADAG